MKERDTQNPGHDREQGLSRSSKAIYKEIVNQSRDGIVSTYGRRIVVWNIGMESITGIRAKDAVGRDICEIQELLTPPEQKTPELFSELGINMENILKSNDWLGEVREQEIVCLDGTRKIIQDFSYVINDSGEFIGFGIIMCEMYASRTFRTFGLYKVHRRHVFK